MKKLLLIIVATTTIVTTATSQAYKKLSCGGAHTMALTTDNKLLAWGANESGQLGTGNTTDVDSPQELPGTWIDVAACGHHTIALATDSTIWGTGYNFYGQLGNGTTTDLDTFQQISTVKFRSVASGYWFIFAIAADGTLWAAGANGEGQFGNGTNSNSTTLIQVNTDTDWATISCGTLCIMALKNDSTLWSWGANPSGQLGQGHNNHLNVPTQIGTDKYKTVNVGLEHALAIKHDGTLWTWGFNAWGELGRPTLPALHSHTPTQVGTDNDWKYVAAGGATSFVIKNNGTLWGFGANAFGQLGAGTVQELHTPTQIGTDNDWVSVESSEAIFLMCPVVGPPRIHSAGLKGACNEICTTGYNNKGQLGNGTSGSTPQDHFECGIGEIVSVASVANNQMINVYPNPAEDVLYVQYTSQDKMQVLITDVSGKVLVNDGVSGSEIDVSGLAVGNYFIMMRDNSGAIYRGRFVKR